MKNEIIELLENNELRKEIIENVKRLWSYAGTLHDNPDEDMDEYVKKTEGASLWEEAWWRAECGDEVRKIQQAFDKYFIHKMPKPYRLTLEELVTAFWDLVKPHEKHIYEFEQFNSDDCNNLYMVFVNYVANQILSHRYSDPFPICSVTNKEEGELLMRGFLLGYQHAKGENWEPSDLDEIRSMEQVTIWDKNSVRVRLLRGADVIKETPGGKKLYHVLATIEAEMSTSASSVLRVEMSRIVPTAIRSADLLQAEEFGGAFKVIEPTIPLLYEREIGGLPWGEEKLIQIAKPVIGQYLDAYYSDSIVKKDSMNRRIRNAVYLLIESDNQPSNAIGLALSVTAIEALLGEKGPEAYLRLSENVAVLLEPDTSQRHNAMEFVKDLCDARSDALHGKLVETESEHRFYARQLAAAVLSGVISRRDFLSRSGFEPETPNALLQELRKGLFQSGQPLGIEEYNVCSLWRNKKS